MKLKFSLLIILFSASSLPGLYGQPEYYNQQSRFLKANSVWCFGDYAGLNFNSGAPIPFLSSAPWFRNAQINSTSSVADPVTGRLLFYTNGKQFFKASGQPMLNGILSDTSWGTAIVPIVNQPGRYYVFSLNTPDSLDMRKQPGPSGLFYTVVDMARDNGRGDVDPAYQNVLLDGDSLSPVVIAIQGNRCDEVWLVVYHEGKSSVKAYHITPQGIDPKPVISPLPLAVKPAQMVISPDREKIAVITNRTGSYSSLNRLCISDFNASTGQISNTIMLRLDSAGQQRAGGSICFSPDNSKLYAQLSYQQTNGGISYAGIYQYDVSVHDSSRIAQSITYIAETGIVAGHLKLYNDTIYVAGGLPSLGSAFYLSRIHKPNLPGTACEYNNRAIALAAGSSLAWQPFNGEVVIPSSGADSIIFQTDTIVCSHGEEMYINIQSRKKGYDYTWNTGDTTRSILIDHDGLYKVIYKTSMCQSRSETYKVTISNISVLITVNGFELGATGGTYSSYQWLSDGNIIPGATKDKYKVTKNGSYQVIVSNTEGCIDTSAAYLVNNVGINIDKNADEITVYPNPTYDIVHIRAPYQVNVSVVNIDGRIAAQTNNTNIISLNALPNGIYLLKITAEDGKLLKMEKIARYKK